MTRELLGVNRRRIIYTMWNREIISIICVKKVWQNVTMKIMKILA